MNLKLKGNVLKPLIRQIHRKICVERQLSTCASRLGHSPGPLSQFTDDELLMKESVSKLAKEEILPLVRKMEKEGKIDEGLLRKLFENGVSKQSE